MENPVNVLICILALLVGILIGQSYRKWKGQGRGTDLKDKKDPKGNGKK